MNVSSKIKRLWCKNQVKLFRKVTMCRRTYGCAEKSEDKFKSGLKVQVIKMFRFRQSKAHVVNVLLNTRVCRI